MTDGPNRPAVVDASVAVKWVVSEAFSDQANALLNRAANTRQPLLAPSLLPNEVTNAIYQRFRRGHLTASDADAAVAEAARLLRLGVVLRASTALPRQAYAFARTHRLTTVYDALYVVLAQRLNADLWTDDRRLLNVLGANIPWVRWIATYPLPS